MFHPSVTRLIWKEFRTQWHIWLSLLVGAFVLQLMYLWMSPSVRQQWATLPFDVATTLTYCFAATCGALLFAGEREESTFGLLRSLPFTSTQLAIAKLSFAVVSVCVFAVTAGMLGALIWSVDPTLLGGQSYWENYIQGQLLGLLGCLLWSLLFSLLLSRVMVVIVCAILSEFVVTGLITNPLTDYSGTNVAVRLGFYALLAAVDVWLMRRWLRNEPLSLPWEGESASTPQRTGWSTSLSLRTLGWANARRTLGMRTFAVLVWRELKTAVPFVVWWGLLGVLMVDVAVRFNWFPGNFLWLFVTPVVCGLMTCMGDQRHQTYRFLGHRGLSGPSVWLSKHVVWIPVAVGLVAVFGQYDVALESHLPGYTRHVSESSVAGYLDFMFFERVMHRQFAPVSGLEKTAIAFGTGLMLFAIGHLCALWLRRTVVAAATAIVVSLFQLFWIASVLHMDVPFVVSVGPLLLAALVGSLSTTAAWLRDERTWRQFFKQAAWVVLPASVALGGVMGYRSTQIPDVNPGFNWQTWQDRPVASEQWVSQWNRQLDHLSAKAYKSMSLTAELSDDELLANAYEMKSLTAELSDDEALSFKSPGGSLALGRRKPSQAEIDRAIGRKVKLVQDELVSTAAELEKMLDAQPLPFPLDNRQATRTVQKIEQIVPVARQLQEAGDMAAAWQVLRACLRASTFASHATPTQTEWLTAIIKQQQVLAYMRLWANDQQQTVEQLEAATAWFIEHEQERLNRRDGLRNQYVYYRNLLTQQGDHLEQHVLNTTTNPYPFTSSMHAGERERMLRLLGVVTRYHLVSQPGRKFALDLTPQQIDRWIASAPAFDEGLYAFLNNYGTIEQATEFEQQMFAASQATLQATRLIIHLQAYRLREGHFPDRLDDLPGGRVRSLIDDPLGQPRFGYAPQGLDLSNAEIREYQVPPNQPVLWSTGRVIPGLEILDFWFTDHTYSPQSGTTEPRTPADPNTMQFSILRTGVVAARWFP